MTEDGSRQHGLREDGLRQHGLRQHGLRQLSGADVNMLRNDSPRTPNQLAPIAIYDQATASGGLVTFKQILTFVGARLDQWPNSRRRLVHVPFGLDRPYWADDPDFDLEFHVRHISLPQPGDWRQLAIQLARLGSRPLDLGRPPWEMYVIGGLDHLTGLPPSCFAVMLKVHAAAVDGVQFLSGLADLHADTPEAVDGTGSAAGWRPGPAPSRVRLLRRALSVPALRPSVAVDLGRPLIRAAAPVVRDVAVSVLMHPSLGALTRRRRPRVIPLPRTRFNARLSPHRVLQMVDFPAAEYEAIRAAAPGARFETVGLAIIGGALRSYLQAHDELPTSSLTSLVPLATDGRQRLVLATVALGTQLDSPLERLRELAAATDLGPDRGRGIDVETLSALSDALPAVVTGLASRSVVRAMNAAGRVAGAHTVLTSVPGPAGELYLAGARLVRLYGLAPLADGIGLVNSLAQVGDTVTLSITADRDLLPDPQLYGACLTEAFEQLRKAVSPKPRRRRA